MSEERIKKALADLGREHKPKEGWETEVMNKVKLSWWRRAGNEFLVFVTAMMILATFFWMLILGVFDILMVIVRLKRRISVGRPIWRWKRERPRSPS